MRTLRVDFYSLLLVCLWLVASEAQIWSTTFPSSEWDNCVSACPNPGSCDSPPTGWSTGGGSIRRWYTQNAASGTPSTGAKWDHTTLTTGGNNYYLHMETGRAGDIYGDPGSSCSTSGTNVGFRVTSNSIDLEDVEVEEGETVYLSLFAWMYGTHVRTLTLSVSVSGGSFTEILELEDSSRINNWEVHQVDLAEYIGETISLRFDGLSGDSAFSDVSIDDLEVYNTGSIKPPIGSEANATWFGLSRRYPDQLAFSPFLRDHVAAYVPADGTIRMWGGYDANNALADKVHVYDVDAKQFLTTSFLNDEDEDEDDSAQMLHNAPLPRSKCATVALDDRMLIYGGSDYRGPVEAVDVTVLYDYSTGNFTQLISFTADAADAPNHFNFPAEGASAVVDPATGDLYLYGGRTTTVQLNFVSRVECDDDDCEFFAVDLQAGPPIPRGRWGHVSTFTDTGGDKRLWIFGGRFQPSDSDVPEIFGDLRVLDIEVASVRWRDIIVHDPRKAPSPRSFPAAAQNEAGDKWIIYGGLDDSDPENTIVYNDVFMLYFHDKYAIWRELGVVGDSIPVRAAHVMVPTFVPEDNQEAFLIIGGIDQQQATANSVEKLDFGSIDDETPPPPPSNDDDGGDDDSVIIIAVVLSVVFGLCLLLLLALLIGTIVSLLVWKSQKKKALQRKYGVGNASATEMEALN